MVQIDNKIVSTEIFETLFVCDVSKCKGMCCVYGDSGAPLEDDETAVLKDIFPKIKKYMTPQGIEAVEQNGYYEIDFDDEKVTPLVGNSEDCAYSFRENDIVYCAIERAFTNGDIDFRKPVSCQLYPIRITKYSGFEAVNFHHWKICSDAHKLGKNCGTPLYIFLKEPIIRKYGAHWYEQLCKAAEHFQTRKTNC